MMLSRSVTDTEIEQALFQIHPTKSSGPYGFTAGFYQNPWETVSEDILGMVKSFFHSFRMLKVLNHTNIIRIPQVDNPTKMTQLCPISLCTVVYKIISR